MLNETITKKRKPVPLTYAQKSIVYAQCQQGALPDWTPRDVGLMYVELCELYRKGKLFYGD